MIHLVRGMLRQLGFDVVRYRPEAHALPDLVEGDARILATARPFTMTSPERIAAMIEAVKYVIKYDIPGGIVECGVWRGGSMMATALTLQAYGDTGRDLYLYDTFEGMTPPTDRDRTLAGRSALNILEASPTGTGTWCVASLDDVRRNLYSTGYPKDKIHFIKGAVEETIPTAIPEHISILRLDTDWYESTKHELLHLYPRLNDRGVLIIDDYGHWQGARAAVDEYFSQRTEPYFFHRIDYTGRIMVRGGSSILPTGQ